MFALERLNLKPHTNPERSTGSGPSFYKSMGGGLFGLQRCGSLSFVIDVAHLFFWGGRLTSVTVDTVVTQKNRKLKDDDSDEAVDTFVRKEDVKAEQP